MVAVMLATGAWASDSYPGVIISELRLEQTYDCRLCHQNFVLEKKATITPFVLSLKQRGLVILNDASLRTALAQNEADLVDSDGDGCTDIAELKAGEDPNVVSCGQDGGTPPIAPPHYGCTASVAPGLMAALSVLLLRRRRT